MTCSKAKSQFKRRSTANNVEIIIPVPSDADSPKFKTSIGAVRYAPEQSAFIWTIKSFPEIRNDDITGQFVLLDRADSSGRLWGKDISEEALLALILMNQDGEDSRFSAAKIQQNTDREESGE